MGNPRESDWMKAFDAYIDKQSRDGGFDLFANRTLSRDVENTIRSQFNERQRMSVASNYFAICCPIMPLGLLGVFFLFDKFQPKTAEEVIATQVKAHQLARQQDNLAQSLYIAAMKQKRESEEKKAGLQCSRPIDGLMPFDENKEKRKKPENAWMQSGKQTDRIAGPQLLSRPQQDVAPIVKKKLALESHLAEINKEQDYHATCRVSARIELLEKALKKMGC